MTDPSTLHGSPSALYLVGKASDGLRSLPDGSIDCLITSPPYYLQRSYLPGDDPAKADEIGCEDTPGEYLDVLLDLMDIAWEKLADHATFWVNLGQTHAGSGGSGGDYNEGGLREGQARWSGTKRAANDVAALVPWRGTKPGFPRDQSVCWLPELFGASLAYGRNLLTGADHRCWITRPPVTWCKPSVSPGALERRFRTATESIIYGGKTQRHFFDLDAVRTDPIPTNERNTVDGRSIPGQPARMTIRTNNRAGAPPFNWWVIGHGGGYAGAHFATFPEALLERPIEAGCPAKVCLDCGNPIARVVESGYIGEPDDSTRNKKGGRIGGVDDPPEKGWERYRNTVGWDCGCPGGGARWRQGIVCDPFAGTGTSLIAAVSRGRSAVGIDLDRRNAGLARDRVGMFLTVDGETRRPSVTVAAGAVL